MKEFDRKEYQQGKLFHIFGVRLNDGRSKQITGFPMDHLHCCNMLSNLVHHTHLRYELRESADTALIAA